MDNNPTKYLRQRLAAVALSRRRGMPTEVDLDAPRLVEADSYYADGTTLPRKRIILRSNGCRTATCTMCPFTNETTFGTGRKVREENYIRQIRAAFSSDRLDDYGALCIYNDGSFFSEGEMPRRVRVFIYSMIADSRCNLLVVESSPQFVTRDVLEEAGSYLKGKGFSVGLGLQSASSLVRELCINTSFSTLEFEEAISLLREFRCIPKVYLLIKAPFLTEREAISDAIESARYLGKQNIRDVTFCPVRVSRNTVVSLLHSLGLFRPPWLWSIVRVLTEVSRFLRPRVACLNLTSTDFESIHPMNCARCSETVTRAIESFSATGDVNLLCVKSCECEGEYGRYLEDDNWGGLPIPERVEWFLAAQQAQPL